MKRLAAYVVAAILLMPFCYSYAMDRFKSGPQMITDGVEYISYKSHVVKHVLFNLYIHPSLAQQLNSLKYSPEQLEAEGTLEKSAKALCDKNKSDFCKVYFWSNLNLIPISNNTATEEDYLKAQGIYEESKDSRGVVVWTGTNLLSKETPKN